MRNRNGVCWSGRCEGALTDRRWKVDRYAGIDWASAKHDVLVGDEAGAELLAATFVQDEKGLAALFWTLVRLGVGLVVIERPDGLLVERLLDAGLRVLALHPTRSRRRVIGSGSRAGSRIGSTR